MSSKLVIWVIWNIVDPHQALCIAQSPESGLLSRASGNWFHVLFLDGVYVEHPRWIDPVLLGEGTDDLGILHGLKGKGVYSAKTCSISDSVPRRSEDDWAVCISGQRQIQTLNTIVD